MLLRGGTVLGDEKIGRQRGWLKWCGGKATGCLDGPPLWILTPPWGGSGRVSEEGYKAVELGGAALPGW